MNETATTDKPAAKAAKGAKATQAGSAGAAAADASARPVFHISPDKLNLAEQVRNAWVGVVPAGTVAEDLDLRSEPFALVAQLLNKGDDIRLLSGDERTIIDCVCVHRAGTRALCRVTQVIKVPAFNLDDVDRIPDGFEIVRAKPDDVQPGWLIRRKSDGALLNGEQHIHDRERALRFLLDHASVRGETPQALFRPTMT